MKTDDAPEVRVARLEDYMRRSIPLVTQMQVQVAGYDDTGLTLSAPLAPNINHERTAFGGSLASLATLACWGCLWLLLEDKPSIHMVVNEAHMRYLKPVTGELSARCATPAAAEQSRFLEMLTRRGKARLELRADITERGVLCAEYTGSFVAYREGANLT